MKEEINQPRGPWFTNTREILHSNKYGLRLIRDEVKRPNGSEGIYDYLKLRGNGGAYVLPLDDNGNIFLVRQFRYPANKWTMEAASGGMEEGQDFIDLASAELKQELGIRANIWDTLMERTDPAPHIIDSPQRLYLARDLSFYETEHEDTEQNHLSIKRIKLEDALEMVKRSEITETPTCLTIALAYNFLRNL
ncbi:MAG: NUDIX hydrolase [Nanoarchaeota archaeon]|nr:NUDIX hydrolase [Nanoarchaeota archaeon]